MRYGDSGRDEQGITIGPMNWIFDQGIYDNFKEGSTMDQRCFFCNTETNVDVYDAINKTYFVKCPVCGRYETSMRFVSTADKDKVACFLYHHEKEKREADDRFFYFLGAESEYNEEFHWPKFPMRIVSYDEIRSFFPNRFSDKVDMSLLAIAKKSRFYGDEIDISDDEMLSLLFACRFDEDGEELPSDKLKNQYNCLLDYFKSQDYIEAKGHPQYTHLMLLPNGWKQIERLQTTGKQNKDVFVSMSFADDLKPTREAIRKGIIDAGFSPEFMDEIIHNRQIVPEMFRLIRESKFLIMDISEPNYGAYYEAGYALGLGKEVIISCSKKAKDRKLLEEEKKYEKYLRPHFDIAQKQILFWNDTDDLSKQLTQWIKALF